MSDILTKILAQKKVEVDALDLPSLRHAVAQSPQPRDFLGALKRSATLALIAELKRASPSRGLLAENLDILDVAQTYAAHGATAISVLTDEKFFHGSLETLRSLRFDHKLPLPLLRKDFIIDVKQIFQARAAGADAILLIAAALPDDAHFASLHACAVSLGLTVLVEVHDEHEIERSLRLPDLHLLGINNRNLATFEIALETSERLRPLIPPYMTVVAESAIFSRADVTRLAGAHLDAILVGEALIISADIAVKVRELSSVARQPAKG
jgi:indole-3-glycerol phosphate synthase